ncbi:uncharacterized protein (TIGR03118 family) [Nitrobacteraceae bacterium AZCC 1564]
MDAVSLLDRGEAVGLLDRGEADRLLDHGNRLHRQNQEEVSFTQTNLVADSPDTPGVTSTTAIDPNLINPWGIAHSPTSPFWISNNGTGTATIVDGNGMPAGPQHITVAALPGEENSNPTGQVFNGGGGFNVTNSDGTTGSSLFMFATESGTISGWNPNVDPTSSIIAVDNSDSDAVYKGLAIGTNKDGTFLFAADFHNGKIDVFDQNFQQVNTITDKHLPQGFAPFNVQVLDGHLFVTYALQDADKEDDVAGPGNGFVVEFDLQGHLLKGVASRGPLDSPWGLAIAPPSFGQFAGDLLVGNFGDGTINAFNMRNNHFEGKLLDANGAPITIGDLWALIPGNGSANTDPNKIYFSAGVEDEAQGLFGSLTAVPEPDQSAMSMPGSRSALLSMLGSHPQG